MFWIILGIGIAFVFVQGFFAHCDKYLTQKEMQSHGVRNGYSFMEHGGMWSDVFIISPIVAYILTVHHINTFLTWYGILILVISTVVSVLAAKMYERMSQTTPEAHAHGGKTTVTGWIHVFYAVIGMWVILMFYFTPLESRPTGLEIIVASALLTPFFYLGVKKFNPNWRMSPHDKWQVGIMTALVWLVAGVRILLLS